MVFGGFSALFSFEIVDSGSAADFVGFCVM